jgi:sarcosine oxidase subunit delta
MMLLNCPNCGPRNADEFRYGGELRRRPTAADGQSREWTDYLYKRQNPRGPLEEWWHHRLGCGEWFIVERNSHTQAIKATYPWPKGDES